MNKNTELERELLQVLNGVEYILTGVKNKTIFNLTGDEVGKLEEVLRKVTIVYPSVRFPSTLRTGCGSCVNNFITDMMPVYDRLTMQEQAEAKANEVIITEEIVEPEALKEVKQEPLIGSVEYNEKNINVVNPFNPIGHDEEETKETLPVVEKVKKRPMKRKSK